MSEPTGTQEALSLWTLEEISAQMSVKKETVGTRLFYARKRIQACLSALLARERGLQEAAR